LKLLAGAETAAYFDVCEDFSHKADAEIANKPNYLWKRDLYL
jgi:hypothetical protein